MRAVQRCVLLAAVLLATGCATPDTPPPAPAAATAGAPAEPVSVSIPRIGAESNLIPLGLTPDGAMAVPDTAGQAGWYEHGPRPGAPGPAIVVGHVDYKGEQGVFGRLTQLRVGDDILIGTADGTVLRYRTHRVQQVGKDDFPWDQVARDTPWPELRVVTCTGAFDRVARSYVDNLIVYARLVPGTP